MPDRRLRLSVLAVASVMLVVLSGCASTRTASPSAAAPAVQTTRVDMPPSYRFEPASIQVNAGASVTWTNSDNFTHSVQVDGTSDVHVVKPGESTSITFDRPGTYTYVCTFHPQNMRGTVTVS